MIDLTMKKFDESIQEIKEYCEILNRRNEKLVEENKRLQEDRYKDEELAKMRKERDTAINDMYRGFPISEEEQTMIDTWIDTHECKHRGSSEGAIGGRYTYTFCPTSIGVLGTIECSCGKTFTFQDMV